MICIHIIKETFRSSKKLSEKGIPSFPPSGFCLHMMPGKRKGDITLGRCDLIVSREIGVWRTDIILKSESHEYGTCNPVGKILHIEIGERAVKLFIGQAQSFSLGQYRTGRPACNAEIVHICDTPSSTACRKARAFA